MNRRIVNERGRRRSDAFARPGPVSARPGVATGGILVGSVGGATFGAVGAARRTPHRGRPGSTGAGGRRERPSAGVGPGRAFTRGAPAAREFRVSGRDRRPRPCPSGSSAFDRRRFRRGRGRRPGASSSGASGRDLRRCRRWPRAILIVGARARRVQGSARPVPETGAIPVGDDRARPARRVGVNSRFRRSAILAGSVRVPSAKGDSVSGRFRRPGPSSAGTTGLDRREGAA